MNHIYRVRREKTDLSSDRFLTTVTILIWEATMPLDIAGSYDILRVPPRARMSLQDAADALRIRPISLSDLATHKETEAAKHPGSRLLRHQQAFEHVVVLSFLAGLITAVATVLGFLYALSQHEPTIRLAVSGIAAIAICCGSIWISNIQVKAPAKWIENYGPINKVPRAIADLAWAIHLQVPRARFVIGTLVQETVELDPYLMMELPITRCDGIGYERIVIGIWDAHGVLRIASRD
jgi:hypothetical protein